MVSHQALHGDKRMKTHRGGKRSARGIVVGSVVVVTLRPAMRAGEKTRDPNGDETVESCVRVY